MTTRKRRRAISPAKARAAIVGLDVLPANHFRCAMCGEKKAGVAFPGGTCVMCELKARHASRKLHLESSVTRHGDEEPF